MHSFGCMEEFQIQYEFTTDCNQQQDSFEDTWGGFRFWVSGRDLCEYSMDGISDTYEDHLFWITEWLCESLRYIVGYDPFPISISGNNAMEMIENANIRRIELFDAGDECEMLLLARAKDDWCYRHGWFARRGGSILPHLFFRRLDDDIEISWNSTFWMEDGVHFKHPVGCHIIRLETFKRVIFDFLRDYLKRWEQNALKYKKPLSSNPSKGLSDWYYELGNLGFSRDIGDAESE